MTKSGKIVLISGIVLGVAIIGFLVYNYKIYGTALGIGISNSLNKIGKSTKLNVNEEIIKKEDGSFYKVHI